MTSHLRVMVILSSVWNYTFIRERRGSSVSLVWAAGPLRLLMHRRNMKALLFLQRQLCASTPGAAASERFRPFGLLCLAPGAVTLLKGMFTDCFFGSSDRKSTTLTQSCVWLIPGARNYALLLALVWRQYRESIHGWGEQGMALQRAVLFSLSPCETNSSWSSVWRKLIWVVVKIKTKTSAVIPFTDV